MSQQAMRVDGRVPDIFDPIQCRRKGIDGTDTYVQALIEDQAKGIKVTVAAGGEKRGTVSIDLRDGVNGSYIHRHFTQYRLGPAGLTIVDDPALPEGTWNGSTYVADSKSTGKDGHVKYNLGGNYANVELQVRLHGRYSGNGCLLTIGYEDDSAIAYQARMTGWGFYDVDFVVESYEPVSGGYAVVSDFDNTTPGTEFLDTTTSDPGTISFDLSLDSKILTLGIYKSDTSGDTGAKWVAAEAAESVGNTGSALKLLDNVGPSNTQKNGSYGWVFWTHSCISKLSYVASKNGLASYDSSIVAFKLKATDTVGDIVDYTDIHLPIYLPFLLPVPGYPGQFYPSNITISCQHAINPLIPTPPANNGIWTIQFPAVVAGAGFGGNPVGHSVATGVARSSWLDFSIQISSAGLVTVSANGVTYSNDYGMPTPAMYQNEIYISQYCGWDGGTPNPVGLELDPHTMGPVILDVLNFGALSGTPL